MSDRRIFLVANSHIDPVWLWDKYEGMDEVIKTFRGACDRLDDYSELKFSASSICFYRWVEQYAPEVFERIRTPVRAGHWEITGGWWVESDCNLPLSESFHKSAEISKAYISSWFGVDIPVAYSPDAFGHSASLTGILVDTGFKYYVFSRPDETEKPDLPEDLFYWEHGGKRVLCYRLKYHYTQVFLGNGRRIEEDLSDAELGGVHDACSWLSHTRLREISAAIPVKCPQGEFRIFNSLPEAVTGSSEIESFIYFRPGASFKDSSGRKIPIQEITPSVSCVNRRWLFVDTFPAKTMKSYYFDSDDAPPIKQDTSHFYIAGDEVSTANFKIHSPGNIVDIRSGVTFFKSPISLGVIEDQSDTWSHGIRGYGQTGSHFEEVSSSVCRGPLASFLISRQRYGHSAAELAFKAYENLQYVDIEVKVNWDEKRSILKLEIEPNCDFDSLLVQGPAAVIEKRTDGAEEPMHGWLLAGQMGIIQDGVFALDRRGGMLRITLVRSNLYGYDKSWLLDSLEPLKHTDLGEHRFKFRFLLRKDVTGAAMDKLCATFKEPFHVIRTSS